MASADIDFMSIGVHCKVPGCNRLDFLPTKCRHCALVTCAEHATPSSHACSHVESKNVCQTSLLLWLTTQRTVPVCPLCSKLVQTPLPGQSLNDQMERHIQSGCKDLLAAPAKPPRKCTCKGCKTRDAISFSCSHCRREFCVGHRMPQDHSCSALERR